MIRSLVASSSKQSMNRLPKDRKESLVLLSALPVSATLTDIRALTHKAPKPSVTPSTIPATPRDYSTSSLAGNITSIDFIRTKLLNQSGKVVVRFRDFDRAKEFAETAHERVVGGSRIKAQVIERFPSNPHPIFLLLQALQNQSPGRVVLIKGMPAHFTSGRLQKVLSRSYALAKDTVPGVDNYGEHIETGPVVKLKDSGYNDFFASFLVRLQTVSAATMLVRRWHRTVWKTRDDFRLEASNFEAQRSDNSEEDIEEDDRDYGQERKGMNWKALGAMRSTDGDYTHPENVIGRTIDAHLMH